ncbi:MAG: RNA-binding S4 domain-containing protein [Gemmatimonadales bacterium]
MPDDTVRLDKWLWAARFFKTRSTATEAVHGGKVEVNGQRPKPAHLVRFGDTIRLRLAPYDHVVVVTGIAERRGSAAAAAALFQETAASLAARERLREQLRLAPSPEFTAGKPTKQDRRALEKVRGRKS